AGRGLYRAESSTKLDSMPDSVTYCGRTFSSHELELMRQIASLDFSSYRPDLSASDRQEAG
ncbi:MAG: hypothetical protein ABR880_24480, partial [Candidatus Sulfotelmatobacter sp.]